MTNNHQQSYCDEMTSRFARPMNDIKSCAHDLHASVNQFYDRRLPYSVHLDMVAHNVIKYGPLLPLDTDDFLAVWFGAYFHDSIEDARLTYNDVTSLAKRFMPEQQARLAAEIVYALTNEKGRTRAERANDRYYAGIRQTPYAPFVKLADRLANLTFSTTNNSQASEAMKKIYRDELPHFLESITSEKAAADRRYALPAAMVDDLISIIQ